MDEIWDRKSFEVGRCAGDEKPECPRRTDKSRTLKQTRLEADTSTENHQCHV